MNPPSRRWTRSAGAPELRSPAASMMTRSGSKRDQRPRRVLRTVQPGTSATIIAIAPVPECHERGAVTRAPVNVPTCGVQARERFTPASSPAVRAQSGHAPARRAPGRSTPSVASGGPGSESCVPSPSLRVRAVNMADCSRGGAPSRRRLLDRLAASTVGSGCCIMRMEPARRPWDAARRRRLSSQQPRPKANSPTPVLDRIDQASRADGPRYRGLAGSCSRCCHVPPWPCQHPANRRTWAICVRGVFEATPLPR